MRTPDIRAIKRRRFSMFCFPNKPEGFRPPLYVAGLALSMLKVIHAGEDLAAARQLAVLPWPKVVGTPTGKLR
jgi:hypothetical protein